MQEACAEVSGFGTLYDKLQQKTSISGKAESKILFPVRAMSRVYRGKYCHLLKQELPQEYAQIQSSLYKHDWVVYAKQPFGGPEQVVEYLGRYTHNLSRSAGK